MILPSGDRCKKTLVGHTVANIEWSNDRKVVTAVWFLIEAFGKWGGNSEQKLRSYLANRRGLNSKQIDEAFRVCPIWHNVKPLANVEEKSEELVGAKYKSADWKLETVVEFLKEIEKREEDYPEQKIRQYLVKRQGHSKKQIDKAFRIYRIRQNAKQKHLAKTEENSNEEVTTIGDHNATHFQENDVDGELLSVSSSPELDYIPSTRRILRFA